MLAEIAEQGVIFDRWAASDGFIGSSELDRILDFDPCLVLTIARGTSDRAAEYGKYLFDILLGIPTGSTSPSTVTLFGATPKAAGALAIGVSQSGESPDIVAEAKALRDGGALLLAVTNAPRSPLAKQADIVINVDVGPELAVAATKSFSAQCLALADIVTGMAGVAIDRISLAKGARAILESDAPANAANVISAALDDCGFIICLGRGPNTPMAQEGALKIMETVGVPVLGYSMADFAHGPRTLIRSGVPIIVAAPPGKIPDSFRANIRELEYEGAVLVSIGDSTLPGFNVPIVGESNLFTPILQGIALHKIAVSLSILKGLNPDSPRSLTKVTRTT